MQWLTITCKYRGIISINGDIAGDAGSLTIPLPEHQKIYFSYSALEDDVGYYILPFSRIIDFDEEISFLQDGQMTLTKYDLGINVLDIFPQKIPKMLPESICSKTFPGVEFYARQKLYYAYVYKDFNGYLTIEEVSRRQSAFVSPLLNFENITKTDVIKLNGVSLLFVEGTFNNQKLFALYSINPEFSEIICVHCQNYALEPSKIIITASEDVLGLSYIYTYSSDGENITLSGKKCKHEKPDMSCIFEMLCSIEQDTDFTHFISKSLLNEMPAQDIRGFLEDFCSYCFPVNAQTPYDIALKYKIAPYIYEAKTFRFELSGGKIDNIIEL